MSWPRRIAVASPVWIAVLSSPARAHEVSTTRFDAPIPLGLLYVGTGLTVALTAALLVVAVREHRAGAPTRSGAFLPPPAAMWFRRIAGALFLGAVVAALVAGLFGRQVRAENLATVFVWPIWLEGVALLSAVFGSPWRVLSPWRTVYDLVTRFEPGEVALLGSYPPRLGTWPALGFFVGLGLVENLTLVPHSPRATAAVVAGYALCMLVGAFLFGTEWFEKADALAVLYRLLGRIAPLRVSRTDAGGAAVSLRAPWTGCLVPVVGASSVAFVVAIVYTVTFDGFANTPEYQELLFAARDVIAVPGGTATFLYLFGYLCFVAGFSAISRLTRRSAGRWDGTVAASAALAPTVLPIAVAYEFAHYYPFVVDNLAIAADLAAEALLGAHVALSPLSWLSLPMFWLSQVGLIVAGHVVAVVAVHYVVTDRVPSNRLALATAPTTVLMIGYTVLSLWIVSRPVVS